MKDILNFNEFLKNKVFEGNLDDDFDSYYIFEDTDVNEYGESLNESILVGSIIALGIYTAAQMKKVRNVAKKYRKALINKETEIAKFNAKIRGKDLDKVDKNKIEDLRDKKKEKLNAEVETHSERLDELAKNPIMRKYVSIRKNKAQMAAYKKISKIVSDEESKEIKKQFDELSKKTTQKEKELQKELKQREKEKEDK